MHGDAGERPPRGRTHRRGGRRRAPRPFAAAFSVAALVLVLLSGVIDLAAGSARDAGTGERQIDIAAPSATPSSPLVPASGMLEYSMDWVAWTPPPASLSGAGFAANASAGSGVLFGGSGTSGLSNATYLYSEATNGWSRANPTESPSARSNFGFADDPATDTAVLFGGAVNGTTLAVSNATWLFDLGDQQWTNISEPTGPAARQDPAFAVGDGVALLYGGWAQNLSGIGELTYADTWLLNLTTDHWSQIRVAGPTPGPIHGASLAWQPTLGEFLLYGGCYPCSTRVWAFAPANETWQVVASGGAVPPPRMDAMWIWDPASGVDVLFGGTNGTMIYGTTYYYQPTVASWTLASVSTAPPARYGAAADFLDLPDNATVLMVGGTTSAGPIGDAWRLSLPANLTVKVANAASGLGIANATVQAGSFSGLVTNETGFTSAEGIPATETNVTATQAGFLPRTEAVWLPPGGSVEILLTLTPLAPATVDVFVDNLSALPVAGAAVSLTYGTRPLPDSPMFTDATGEALYTDVPSANYTLRVDFAGYHASTTEIDAAAGKTLTVNVTLSPLFVLVVETRARLPNGTLVPLLGVAIFVNNALVGSSGAGGAFTTTLSGAGSLPVKGSLYGFVNATEAVNVTFTGTGFANLTLPADPYPTITIEVLGQRGTGPGFQVAGANVSIANVSSDPIGPYDRTFKTNLEGTVTFSPPTGNYSVRLSAPGYFSNDSVPDIIAPPGADLSRTCFLSLIGFSNIVVLVLSTGTGNPPIPGATVDLRFIGTNLSTGLPFPNATRVSDAGGYSNFSGVPQAKTIWAAFAAGYVPGNGTFSVVYGSPSNRFTLYLVPIPPPKYAGLRLFPVAADSVWVLGLVPVVGLLAALVYLTMLRNPTSRAREVREEAEADRAGRGRSGRPP